MAAVAVGGEGQSARGIDRGSGGWAAQLLMQPLAFRWRTGIASLWVVVVGVGRWALWGPHMIGLGAVVSPVGQANYVSQSLARSHGVRSSLLIISRDIERGKADDFFFSYREGKIN